MNLPLCLPIQSANQPYVGRFAPSPSGPLHFGSLVAALGSYLRAKQQNGRWLVRIEDIDPPREQLGAAANILATLEQHGLHWDGPVVYQSLQSSRYEKVLEELKRSGLTYNCHCTRKQWLSAQLCSCRELNLAQNGCSTRLKNDLPVLQMLDNALGLINFDRHQASEDFVLRRKDGLYAYQLAVVLDDIHQGITEVVRGADLLSASAYQLALFRILTLPAPRYLHLPVVLGADGHKLSKQNHAPALDNTQAQLNLANALGFLGAPVRPSLANSSIGEILHWGQACWKIDAIAGQSGRFDNRIGEPDSI